MLCVRSEVSFHDLYGIFLSSSRYFQNLMLSDKRAYLPLGSFIITGKLIKTFTINKGNVYYYNWSFPSIHPSSRKRLSK